MIFKEIVRSVAIALVIFSCSVYAIIFSILRKTKKVDQMLHWWGKKCLALSDANLHITGIENLPDEGVILGFNHVSHFDIPIIYAAINKNIRFGAKIELYSIPVFGQALKWTGTLPIARSDRTGVKKVYQQAAQRAARGESFALAPEGTRQHKPGIGEFKLGPFILAIEAKVKFVPVVIRGAEKIMMKNDWHINLKGDRNIYVEILNPIETKEFIFEDRYKLRDFVRERMRQVYDKLPS